MLLLWPAATSIFSIAVKSVRTFRRKYARHYGPTKIIIIILSRRAIGEANMTR